MKRPLAAICALIIIGLLSELASADTPLHHYDTDVQIPNAGRDAFYCQDPDYMMIYNMSSGFEAEIADDIPDEWVGYHINSITLWYGEWYAGGSQGWREPVGLRVNLYQESCPPEMVPDQSIEIAWNDLDKVLVESSSSRWIYEVHVPLSPALLVEPGMSLGATALIDWGQEEPFCGIVATPFYVNYGACSAHLDGENWGYIRWTEIDEFTTINQDLAYCLEGSSTSVPEAGHNDFELSARPNPFNPKTTISYSLPQRATISLSLFDVTGRLVDMLIAEENQPAGTHTTVWTGRNSHGSAMPSGTYFYRLEAEGFAETKRVTLIR